MRPPHRILDRNKVHRLAAEHLQAHLKFKDYKRKTSAQVLWSLLLAAAAHGHLAVRCLSAPRQGPLRRDRTQGTAGYPARLRRPATTAQRRAGRAPAQGAPQAPSAPGHRPDVDPLPRRALPRPQRDLPGSSQGRDQPLPCLRHRLRRPQGATVHRRLDRRPQGRAAQGGGPTPAPSSLGGGHPAPVAPARSWLLQRGRGPLPPAGAVPVPDAGGLPRPLPQAARRPDRQLCLPHLEDERLGRATP